MGRIQGDVAQQGHALQRAHIGQLNAGAGQLQQGLLAGIGQGQVAGAQVPGQLDAGLGCLGKRHFQLGSQRGLGGAHRQVGWQVGQVGGEVDIPDGQRGLGVQAVAERLGAGLGFKRAAVEAEGQLGLHPHFAHGFALAQGVDERDGQVQRTHLVLLACGGIVEGDFPIDQLDVVDGQAGRRGVGFGRGGVGGQVVEDVLHVQLAVFPPGEAEHGVFHPHRIDHRGQSEKGGQLGVGVQALDGELAGGVTGFVCVRSLAGAAGFGDAQAAHLQLQCPRGEGDALHRDLAAQCLAGLLFHLGFEYQWQALPGQQNQQAEARRCFGHGRGQPLAPGWKCGRSHEIEPSESKRWAFVRTEGRV